MADISRLMRLVGGVQRGVDLSANALLVDSLKVGAGQTELTQAILDKLVAMQGVADADGSYDSRYFTETELGDSTATSGSDLIGDDDTYSNFTPAAATIKGALSGIDSALASAGSDELVKVSANDTTGGYLEAKIVVSDGSNSANILELSTLNDAGDEDLQIQIDQSKIDHGSLAGLGDDDHTQYIRVDGTRAFSGDQSMGGSKLTSLAAGSAAGDAVNKAQLDVVSSLIENFEWQDSAFDYVVDNTVAPATEVSGDRYILSHDGGAPHADYDGASAGDIVEFDGSVWQAVTPTLGTFISADDESSVLYYWGGAAWSTKAFESTTASTGLTKVGFDIRLDSSAGGAGLGFASGILSVNVDDSTIEIDTDSLRVKDAGITEAKIANGAVTSDKILNEAIDANKLADNAVVTVKINDAAVTEAKIADGSVSDAKVKAGSGLEEAVTFFGATDLSGAEAETLSDGSNADSLHSHSRIVKSFVAGEAFAANTTFLVRMAVSGETAGRVYKADHDASASDEYYVYGVIEGNAAAAKIAGDAVDVVMLGEIQLGSSDTAFAAGEIGQPVHLLSSGAFDAVSQITYAADQASYRVGMVQETNKILVGNMQLLGIN